MTVDCGLWIVESGCVLVHPRHSFGLLPVTDGHISPGEVVALRLSPDVRPTPKMNESNNQVVNSKSKYVIEAKAQNEVQSRHAVDRLERKDEASKAAEKVEKLRCVGVGRLLHQG